MATSSSHISSRGLYFISRQLFHAVYTGTLRRFVAPPVASIAADPFLGLVMKFWCCKEVVTLYLGIVVVKHQVSSVVLILLHQGVLVYLVM